MEIKEIEEQLEKLKKEQKVINSELRKVEAKSTKIYNKISKLKEEKDKILLNEMTLDNVDWEYLLKDASTSTKIKYQKIESILQELKTKYKLPYSAITHGTYLKDTNQMSLNIGLDYNDDEVTKNVIKILYEILPYIKPLKDGYKYFEIFAINEDYGYNLLIDESGKARVKKNSRYNNDCKWDSFENTMKYIQKNLYYEGP